jgi:hypothetical protein
MSEVPVCRLCGRTIWQIGGYLGRVNKRGEVPAVWECRPSCTADMPFEVALSKMLEEEDEKPKS